MLEYAGIGWNMANQAIIGWNRLEQAGIEFNRHEQPKISWNKLIQACIGWNMLKLNINEVTGCYRLEWAGLSIVFYISKFERQRLLKNLCIYM